MHRIQFNAFLFLALLLASTLPCNAALISASDLRFGQDSLTVDTTTGLEWLDLPLTTGYSYQTMNAALRPGGTFAGFRYATAQEVSVLYVSAGIPGTGWFPTSSPSLQPIVALIALVGPTSEQDGHPEAGAISGTWGSIDGLIRPVLDFAYQNGVSGYDVSGFPNPKWEFGETTPGSSWLVRPIPEPGVGWIGVMGGLFLVAIRGIRRRHNGRSEPRVCGLSNREFQNSAI
jgi:hypothetical protein